MRLTIDVSVPESVVLLVFLTTGHDSTSARTLYQPSLGSYKLRKMISEMKHVTTSLMH